MQEESVKYTPEYKAIQEFYGDRVAHRSGVMLINHINEGLEILEKIGSTRDAMRAFCLHPLFQHDDDLSRMMKQDLLYVFSPRCVALTMEYRARANDWLSEKVFKVLDMNSNGKLTYKLATSGQPFAGKLLEVKHMLIADKVQNYKDFLTYHFGKHERSEELNFYFLEWFKALDIGVDEYTRLIQGL